MKYVLGGLALALAAPAAAQAAPAADPHVGHAQHQSSATAGQAQHGGMDHSKMMGMDHARMMEKCKDPAASAETKAECAKMMEHCAAMMKQHGQSAPASSQQPKGEHGGHAH